MKGVFTVASVLVAASIATSHPPDQPDSWASSHADAARVLQETNHAADRAFGALRVADDLLREPAQASGGVEGGVQDWPPPPAPFPTISMRVRAIFVADDDGQRRVPITPAQVAQWVNHANILLGNAAISLEFDASPGSGDWEERNSTLLNTMTGIDHPNWSSQRALGNAIAAETPTRMVVFFRWGPGFTPTGGGFSWTDYNFIVMPGFDVTTVCGEQNSGLFAHEVGHYLGLPHTFSQIFASSSAAQSFFLTNGSNPRIFDGDGRDETGADPFIDTSFYQCTATSVTLGGVQFILPRSNVMSYYHPVSAVETSQAGTIRQALLLRSLQPLASIVDGPAAGPIEAESLATTITGGSAFVQIMSSFLGKWSGDRQQIWIDGAVGRQLITTIQSPRAGLHRLYASFTAAPDFGIVTHRIGNQTSAPLDLYARIVLNTGPVLVGEFMVGAGANHVVIEIVGSNLNANPVRYGYGVDYFLLETVCPADLNGNGAIDGVDLASLLAEWGTAGASDLNGDGVINGADLASMLAAWGPCE